MVPTVRTNISPGITWSWEDVDVTALVDAGNTAGVMLEIVNTDAGNYRNWGVQKNGSGDVIRNDVQFDGHTLVAIGVDANDIFECFIETVAVEVYIVGYILNTEGSFLINSVDKSLPGTGWQDIDISADTGGETAVCAFLLATHPIAGRFEYGFRRDGSGDDRRRDNTDESLLGSMMAVSAVEILEGYQEDVLLRQKIYLVGWLTNNFGCWTNGIDYSTANLAVWEDVDMSADIPAGWNGAFLHLYGDNHQFFGIRKKGAVYDNYKHFYFHNHGWVEIDANRIARQKIENVSCDLFLWGYTRQPAGNAPTAPTGQQIDSQSSPTGENCISSLTPGFTAIYNDPDAGGISNAINIQVGTASGLSDMWDSGWLADSTVTPNRCTAKTYAGAALSTGTSYWWRCRFRDDGDLEGAWSAWQQFDICEEVPAEIPLQCVPGGPLPRRRPFICAVRVPLLEPSRRFPFEFPVPRSPCN